MNYNGEYSLSDIAAVTKGSNNDNDYGNGFGAW